MATTRSTFRTSQTARRTTKGGLTFLREALAPADAPEKPHEGANRALPMSQSFNMAGFDNKETYIQRAQIYEILRDVFLATKCNYLSSLACVNAIKVAEDRYGVILKD